MSDSTSAPKASGSLADRISQPPTNVDATSATAPPSGTTTKADTETKTSWADEVASPVAELPKSMENDQVDGSTEHRGGSALLPSGEFEVEVKLSDIQGDTSSPLYSITSFDELGMYVMLHCFTPFCWLTGNSARSRS